MAILTKAVSVDEAGQLASLHQKCFTDSWGSKEFAELMNNPVVLGLIHTQDKKDIGMALLQTIAGETEILTFGIVPAYRGKGLGYGLLQACVNRAVICGARAMFLEVSSDNHAARNLYSGFGFQQVSVRKAYYADRSDALICRLSLSSASL